MLAALRLNSPLRGSDSGSLGRQHRKPHDGSLATVRAICFRIHHGCIILRTMFYNAVRLHIAKSSWLAGGRLSGTVLSGQITKHRTEKDRDRVTETCYRHYASVFLLSGILTLLFFIAPKEKIPSTLSARQATFVEAKSCSGKYLWLKDAFCLRDSVQARSFWQCADELHCKTWCVK